jgi:Nickel/cobalt transporter regulator
MRAYLALILIAALAMPGSALAGNSGKKAKGPQAKQLHTEQTASVFITAAERRIIVGHLNQHRSSWPAAFAAAQPLPPGIAKKVARGGALPPGIAKRYLPDDLLVLLPSRPGYEWVVVGADILLVAAATGLIVDVLIDAL